MGSLISIIGALGPLLQQISGILTQAAAANGAGDKATLDSLHAKAVALADSLEPAGPS